jgi:hypothetical protein
LPTGCAICAVRNTSICAIRSLATNVRSDQAEEHAGIFPVARNCDGRAQGGAPAIEYCLKEASAGTNTGRTLEAIDAARSIVRNRA